MKRVIIIDDEQDARGLLREYILMNKGLLIVGEASNGFEAIEIINRLKPDTIFLDIQMPGLNGFEVLTQLEEIPELVFSTAYDQYAIKAFEVHAIDYLLKPYGKKRFENALSRILKNQESVLPLTEELLQNRKDYPDKVILHKGKRKIMVKVSDILCAEAFGDYTKVYTGNEEYLSTKGISLLLEKFDPQTFMRLHRSHFVNSNAIRELKKMDRYYYVLLTNTKKYRVSETYLPQINKLVL